ncbi:hypothetical protein B0F90DRAFT_1722124 [Multifurca ochricompacta]|uniref:Uncharacterized protein n=1 Tax=Multifurca ochricompacta TaxID=376703 RepID=A0AAD4QNH5_9AGAM|nr:hypothetical protein B0F90DRAFT_1722124 [Multifurca ochricompacta]
MFCAGGAYTTIRVDKTKQKKAAPPPSPPSLSTRRAMCCIVKYGKRNFKELIGLCQEHKSNRASVIRLAMSLIESKDHARGPRNANANVHMHGRTTTSNVQRTTITTHLITNNGTFICHLVCFSQVIPIIHPSRMTTVNKTDSYSSFTGIH